MPEAVLDRPVLDQLVIGAGPTGLQRALAARRENRSVLLLEREPVPGGPLRTLRIEGFTCELGSFALPASEYDALAAGLPHPPPAAALQPEARQGQVWDGQRLRPAPVHGEPRAGRTGLEDLVTAHRRELGPALRSGRAVTTLRPVAAGWTAELGGEVPAHETARAVDICTSLPSAARLLARLDPALGAAAGRLQREGAAHVFLGTWQDPATAAALPGYGILADPPAGVLREAIFCSNAFARRAPPGKCLVRIEVTAAGARLDDDALAAAAERELRRLTGLPGPILFRRVHRFAQTVRDGAWTECGVRLRELVRTVPGVHWCGP